MSRRVRCRSRALARLLAAAAVVVAAPPSNATWSIVAVDPATREVGVAGASCIGGVEIIVGIVPGRAAVAAQAIPHAGLREELLARLAAGETPADALAAVADPARDRRFGLRLHRLRQYGVAALDPAGGTATYTGAWTSAWAGTRGGADVSLQGNLLAGPSVLDDALAAFDGAGQADPPGCARTLADRLLEALEAGARAGGDARCAPELAALSAVLVVARPGDAPEAPWIRLSATRDGVTPGAHLWQELRRRWWRPEPAGADAPAVQALRARYEAWRRESGTASCVALGSRAGSIPAGSDPAAR